MEVSTVCPIDGWCHGIHGQDNIESIKVNCES